MIKFHEAQNLTMEMLNHGFDSRSLPRGFGLYTDNEAKAIEWYESVRPAQVGGVKVINCTPHPIRFQIEGDICPCGTSVVYTAEGAMCVNCGPAELDPVLIEVQPSGITLPANATEKIIKEENGIQFVQTAFEPSEDGKKDIEALQRSYRGALIIGSIISAQAYAGDVVSMVPVPGFERVPPAEKRMRADKFNMFDGN